MHLSVHAAIWWTVGIALAVVLVMAVAQLRRVAAEVGRIGDRVEALDRLPLFAAAERFEADQNRLLAAAESIAPLVARAQRAIDVIRRGPIPPELIAAVKRLRAEIADFRAFARR